MPNFVASSINKPKFPFVIHDINFLWSAKSKFDDIVLVKIENEEFFITIKKRKNDFVLKGEKITRPAKVGLLQKALSVFKDEFCKDILSDTIAIKKNRLVKQTPLLVDEECLLNFLDTTKFKKIFIEIGFGSGRHLLYQARKNEDTLVIGIEVYKPCIEQVAKLAIVENLNNILLLNSDARIIFSLIKTGSIDKVFMHFPVPWEKAEHRRVISENFAKETKRILKQNGKFELRSDDRDYIDFSIKHFLNLPHSNLEIQKDVNLQISSKYEDRWKKQQKNIYDMFFTNLEKNVFEDIKFDMDFDGKYDILAIKNSFKNITIKKESYFVHLENCYEKSDDEILIKLSLGAFYKPEHCYIFISSKKCEYFIKKPLATKENFMAHMALKEFLKKCHIL